MINYNDFTLLILGVVGILLHNLIKMNELNKKADSKFTALAYIKTEIYSIIISFLMIIVCIIVKHEIKQLENAGKYLGLGFVCIGYMGQSLLIKFMGKAEKIIE